MTLVHILGWFVILFCLAYTMAVQGTQYSNLEKVERAAIALSIMYLVGVSLVRM